MIKSLYPCFQHWSEGGSVWIISDPHFSEPYQFGNEYDIYSNEARIEIYNKYMMKNDTCICLGDIGNETLIPRIKARYKVLIMGNHDAGASKYKEYFDEVYTGPLVISEKIILSHEPLEVPYMVNIHGHSHDGVPKIEGADYVSYNVAGNIVCFKPFNLGKEIKNGMLQEVQSIHRGAINNQILRRAVRFGEYSPFEDDGK